MKYKFFLILVFFYAIAQSAVSEASYKCPEALEDISIAIQTEFYRLYEFEPLGTFNPAHYEGLSHLKQPNFTGVSMRNGVLVVFVRNVAVLPLLPQTHFEVEGLGQIVVEYIAVGVFDPSQYPKLQEQQYDLEREEAQLHREFKSESKKPPFKQLFDSRHGPHDRRLEQEFREAFGERLNVHIEGASGDKIFVVQDPKRSQRRKGRRLPREFHGIPVEVHHFEKEK